MALVEKSGVDVMSNRQVEEEDNKDSLGSKVGRVKLCDIEHSWVEGEDVVLG